MVSGRSLERIWLCIPFRQHHHPLPRTASSSVSVSSPHWSSDLAHLQRLRCWSGHFECSHVLSHSNYVSALVNALVRKGRPEESPPWCSTRGALALSPSCSPWTVIARTRSWLLLLRAVLVLSRSRWRAPGTELRRGRRKGITSRRGSVVVESVVP